MAEGVDVRRPALSRPGGKGMRGLDAFALFIRRWCGRKPSRRPAVPEGRYGVFERFDVATHKPLAGV
jgi:hypothetical protein